MLDVCCSFWHCLSGWSLCQGFAFLFQCGFSLAYPCRGQRVWIFNTAVCPCLPDAGLCAAFLTGWSAVSCQLHNVRQQMLIVQHLLHNVQRQKPLECCVNMHFTAGIASAVRALRCGALAQSSLVPASSVLHMCHMHAGVRLLIVLAAGVDMSLLCPACSETAAPLMQSMPRG